MKIPSNYIPIYDTHAVSWDDKVVVYVEHRTRDTTLVTIIDRQTGEKVGYGFHNTPYAAFHFLESYFADNGDDFRSVGSRAVSERYSRAVKAAYSN